MRKWRTASAVLVIIGITVAIRLYRLEQSAYTVSMGRNTVMDFRGIEQLHLEDVSTGMRTTLSSDPRHTLVIFASAADCATCLDETRAWNEVATKSSELRVVIVLVRTARSEIAAYRDGFGPNVGLLYDSENLVPLRFRLSAETPMKVLFDSRWRPVYAEGPGSLSSAGGFISEVLRHVGA